MCDTLCLLGVDGAIFAKNSDRPPAEPQVLSTPGARRGGGRLRTQYLTLADPGAQATVLSRPVWLWGAEHGLNASRVAMGNEKLWTAADPSHAPDALIGMDLVRLALERAESADEALEVTCSLLERSGQGGACAEDGDRYFSSFLLADPHTAWILETSGRTWAARRLTRPGGAVSNRISLGRDWDRASADVSPGEDFDSRRSPVAPTGHADLRLAAARRFVDSCAAARTTAGRTTAGRTTAARTTAARTTAARLDPAAVVAHLRDHGHGPWGRPGETSSPSPVPDHITDDGAGVTTCMHVRGYSVTTASLVASLPTDPVRAPRAWAAPGSPCASVYLPLLPPRHVPAVASDVGTWQRFAALARAVEADPTTDTLAVVRAELGPLEAALWREADALADDDDAGWGRFATATSARVLAGLTRLEQILAG